MKSAETTLVIDPVAEDAHRLVAACPDGAAVSDARGAQSWKDTSGTLVVVAGPSMPLDSALALAERLRATSPRSGVVVVRRRLETAALVSAIRAGVREVIAERDLADLSDAVQRAHDHCSKLQPDVQAVTRSASITTVFSAKGGVGKTTVATNLAVHLASRGERVCLIDLDLAFGDVCVALNLFPTHSIAEAVPHAASLDHRLVTDLLSEHSSGLRVLAAPSDPGAAEAVTADLVGEVIDLISESFDHVVLDTPPSLNDVVLAAIDRSDLVMLVATLDVAALKNVRLALETLTLIGVPPERQRLVLNRADAQAGVRPADVPAALGREISATIPSSREVPSSVNAGLTLVESQPRHPVSRAVIEFTDAQIPPRSTNSLPLPSAGAAAGRSAEHGGGRPRGLLRRTVSTR